MKKTFYLTLLFLFFSQPFSWAAPPSRSFTYVTGTTIRSNDVTTNEDNIFSYLQAGVDTYAAGSISNVDIANNAAIAESKLDIGTISGATTFSGDLTVSGTFTANGNTLLGNGADTITINASSGITYTPAATRTFSNPQTVSGTWASLGTVTTFAATGGTLTGITDLSAAYLSLPEQVTGPTTASSEGAVYTKDVSGQPELFYREESDGDEIQLTNAGSVNAGSVLLASADPSTASTIIDVQSGFSSGRAYRVIVSGECITSTAIWEMRINGLSATNYLTVDVNGEDQFQLNTSNCVANSSFSLDAVVADTGDDEVTVQGTVVWFNATTHSSRTIGGQFDNNAVLSQIIIDRTSGTGTFTGSAWIYELKD